MVHSLVILDADAYLAGIYANRFEQAGWKVRVAERFEDAERMVEEDVPSAMIVDIETVPDALRHLKIWKSDPASASMVIAVLTKAVGGHINDALAGGADAYLLKGHFVPQEVVSKLERLVSE